MGPRLYRVIVRLMPRDFRREYGDEMCRVAAEQWDAQHAGAGFWGSVLFWSRQSLAILRASARLRRHPHETTGGMTMDGFVKDVRLALRGLRRRPGFSAIAVLTVALGVGATSAVFSVVDTVVLRPLPYPDNDRLVAMWTTFDGQGDFGMSLAEHYDYAEESRVLEALGSFSEGTATLTGLGEARQRRAC